MSNPLPAIVLLLFGALLPAGCGRERPAPVPRPRAFPRADLYAAAYRPEALGRGDTLWVNDSARVTSTRDGWIDISYPAYGITLNCTLTRGGNIAAALANRAERMALNIGDTAGELSSFKTPRGTSATLLSAPGALRTPVQFLATDSTTWLLSGTAVADFTANTVADSVAPLIRAVEADVTYMLQRL